MSALTRSAASAEDALRVVEKMIEELYADNGNTDQETGARELPLHLQDRAEAYEDVADHLRAWLAAAQSASPEAEAVALHIPDHSEDRHRMG